MRILKYSVIAAAVFAIGVFAQEKVSTGKETLALIREAQSILKSRTSKPENVEAVYSKLFKASDLTQEQRLNAMLEFARYCLVNGKESAANEQYELAMKLPGLSPRQKIQIMNDKAKALFDSNFKGAFSSYYSTGIEKALEIYKDVTAMPEATNPDKIEALCNAARCFFEMSDVPSAEKSLADALTIPGLNEEERFSAEKNIADARMLCLKYDEALAMYRRLYGKAPSEKLRKDIAADILEILSAQKKSAELAKAKEELKLSADVYIAAGLDDDARNVLVSVLEDKNSTVKERIASFDQLVSLLIKGKDIGKAVAVTDKYFPELAAEDKNAVRIYARFLQYVFRRGKIEGDGKSAAYVAKTIIASAPAGAFQKEVKTCRQILYAYALMEHDAAQVKAVAESILADASIDDRDKMSCRLSVIVAESGASADKTLSQVKSVLGEAKLDMQTQAENLLFAAQVAMWLDFADTARGLYEFRSQMLVPEPRRSVVCRFLPKGPREISEFMNSDYFKDAANHAKLDRKYGSNLKFLLDTDAITAERTVTQGVASDATSPTTFVTSCDADGVYFFFFAPNPKVKDIEDGFAKSASYETYLAAGSSEPYHCFLMRSPSGKDSDGFFTQYNNPGFRRTMMSDGTLKVNSRCYDNGIATLLFVSWESFFDKIPSDGDKWEFESIHWANGGYSWGGSKSVHNRSSFGDVVFSGMTKENRNAIKRKIVMKAAEKYRQETSRRSGKGYIDFWEDPELGDQKFYSEKVKALQSELDGYLEKLKPGMTAEDVEFLYEKAAPSWMNIKFIVAEMRRDYLDEKRVNGE